MTTSSSSRRDRLRDKDYAKTIDECLHIELTKHHFVACGAEEPQHKSTLYHKKNPMSQ